MPVFELPVDVESDPEAQAAPSEPASVPEQAAAAHGGRHLWLWLACLVCGLAAASCYLLSRRHPQPQNPVAASVPVPSLAFSVRPYEGALLLTWDASSTAVRTAQRAMLSITDGKRSEDVELYLPQFRKGSLIYDPITEDVTFRLAVTSEGAAETIESVRVLRATRVTPRVEVALAQPQPLPVGEQTLAATALPTPPQPAVPTTEAGSDRRAPTEVPVADIPQPTSGPLRVSSLRVLRTTAILYPPAARQARVSGTVTVEVRVGTDGRVREAAAIGGPEMLRWIAAKGVQEWIFDPPVVDGKRVEASARVDVTFAP